MDYNDYVVHDRMAPRSTHPPPSHSPTRTLHFSPPRVPQAYIIDPSPIPESPDLDREFDRLLTFPMYTLGKGLLAKQGLSYSSGVCKCVFCGLRVDLQRCRDVERYHREKKPDCERERTPRNQPLETVSNYRLERHRLLSFLQEEWLAPVDPHGLAKSGFYRIGQEDLARCHFCRLEVICWEPGDTGYGEHRRFNPRCPFLQGRPVGNVPLGNENDQSNFVILYHIAS